MTDHVNTDYYDDFVDDMLISCGNVKDWTIAMAEEVGELCGKVKRLNRGDYIPKISEIGEKYPLDFILDAGKELGDILYYLVANAHDLGYSLEDIIEGNMEKLRARAAAGTIRGSGDSR